MIKNSKLFVFMILFFIMLILIPTFSFATSPIDNPDYFKPGAPNKTDSDKVVNKVKPIMNAISVIGTVVAVVTLAILGVKFMVGSVSEKAEYKKSMIPYLIGAVLLFATSGVVLLISNLTNDIVPTI